MAPLLLATGLLSGRQNGHIISGTSMAIHLFSTPVECTHCGTVVDDPTVDKCPNCGNLLKERRNPSRLAGVQRRYGRLRFLLGTLRFLGVVVIAVGLLTFIFGEGEVVERLMAVLSAALVTAGLFVIAAFIEIMLDVEENTRASFRLQQMILEALQEKEPRRDVT